MEYIADVYTVNIRTGIPDVCRDATVIDNFTVVFPGGGCMAGVTKGHDFWTDEDRAWYGNKKHIAYHIEFHKRQLENLTAAFLAPRISENPK